jgi:hypothetical protein
MMLLVVWAYVKTIGRDFGIRVLNVSQSDYASTIFEVLLVQPLLTVGGQVIQLLTLNGLRHTVYITFVGILVLLIVSFFTS